MELTNETSFSQADPALQTDLEKFEMRYKYILRTTTLLYERGFHLGMVILMTITFCIMTFFKVQEWYTYALFTTTFILTWYTFYLFEKLRAAMKQVSDESSLLVQMRRRSEVLSLVSKVRIAYMITAVTILSMTLSTRSHDQLFSLATVFLLGFTFILIGFFIYQFRKKVSSTRLYLKNIIEAMESQA